MFGYTDKPIERTANDSFGISGYVNGLCSFILNCDTPMTISIQGDWGSGKTSMMNMIKENISDKVCPIWFNTWQFSQFKMQDELTTSLLYSLLAELDYSKDGIKKIFGFLGGAAKIATGIVTEMVAGGYLAGEVTEAMSGNSYDYAAEIKKLKSRFQEAINEKLHAENKDRVVIFVDDLDRLQPEKAVELLEVLKVFLDCENCVYILAVDYEVVTQGIKKKFGDSVGEQKGKSFFDKIIQLPFKMPVAQYDISRYVSDILAKMNMTAYQDDIKDYVSLISLSIGCNPRSMKRLFNTYQLLDIILKNRFSKADRDNSTKLLFAIICMQTEFEDLYRYIVLNRDVIDVEMLSALEKDIVSNEELSAELNTDDETELVRISNFMEKFNQLLQLYNEELSDESVDKLKELLSFSTVTSVNINDNIETKTDYDWKYRYINRDIVKEVNERLQADYGYNFKVWLAKKNTKQHRISDAWGVLDLQSGSGICYSFGYALITDYSVGITTVNLSIYCRRPTSLGEFDSYFSENPLSYKLTRNSGDLRYERLLRFSANETTEISGKIIPIVQAALSELESFMDRT